MRKKKKGGAKTVKISQNDQNWQKWSKLAKKLAKRSKLALNRQKCLK